MLGRVRRQLLAKAAIAATQPRFGLSLVQRPENGDAPATVRRLHGGAGTYRPGPPNRLSSFVSWLRKPSADMHIRQAADGHQSRISSDGWLDLTSEKGRKELAALRLVESSP